MIGNQHGFTLLELLVSLTILALISLALVGTIRYGRLSWEQAGEFDIHTNASTIRQVLRQKLSNAQPINMISQNGRMQFAFSGASDRITFVTLSQGYTETAGLYRVGIGLFPDEDGNNAINYTQVLFRPGGADDPVPTTRRVLRHVSELRFRYFGRTSTQTTARWNDAWQESDRLPELVKISVNFAADDERADFDLTTPLVAARN